MDKQFVSKHDHTGVSDYRQQKMADELNAGDDISVSVGR